MGYMKDSTGRRLDSFPVQVARRGNRTIGIGDSIMQSADGVFYGFGGSWMSQMCEMSGQRLRRFRNAGVSGNDSSQMLARFAADVLAYNPDVCVLEVVTPNDITHAIPTATSKANIVAMTEACIADGIRPILCVAPPNDTPATNSAVRALSLWATKYANDLGIHVFDLYTPLADPATGKYLASYTSDGLHPNAAGREAVAAYNAARLPQDLPLIPFGAPALGDPANSIPNGTFSGDTNADGYANNWTNSGLTAGSLAARTDGLGYWQSITGDATTDYLGATVSGWSVGDVLRVSGEWINVDSSAVSVILNLTGGTPYTAARPISSRPDIHATARTFYMECPIPSGTTAVQVRLLPGVGTAKFSRVSVENLTALGIA